MIDEEKKMENIIYQQEIEELTNLLRFDEFWTDLKTALEQEGFDIDNTLLVSFVEDEEDKECGVLVTSEKKVYEYTWAEDDFTLLEITKSQEKIDEYPQVAIALEQI